jgi:hypothetical protein
MTRLDKKRRGELLRGVFDVLDDHADGIQAKDALKALEEDRRRLPIKLVPFLVVAS